MSPLHALCGGGTSSRFCHFVQASTYLFSAESEAEAEAEDGHYWGGDAESEAESEAEGKGEEGFLKSC